MNSNYKRKCRVIAPGSVANIVCGFDVMGLCLESPNDWMDIELLDEPKLIIKSADGYPLPEDPEKNTAGAPLIHLMQDLNESIGFKVLIHKKIKPGSGVGSSAASAAGAVVGANYLLNNKFSKEQLLEYALFGEDVASGVKHPDNIAPVIYGGVTLIRSTKPMDIIPLPTPELFVTLIHPQIEVKTADARAVLRQSVPLKDAIRQWANVAGLAAGFALKDVDLIGRSLEDVIIEPVRSILIPGFDEAKKAAKAAGALGGGISGSGPSMFMLSRDLDTAHKVEKAMTAVFESISIPYYVYVTKINPQGAHIEEI